MWSCRSVLLWYGMYVRLEEHAETMKSSVSAQILGPGEIVDRDWFNKWDFIMLFFVWWMDTCTVPVSVVALHLNHSYSIAYFVETSAFAIICKWIVLLISAVSCWLVCVCVSRHGNIDRPCKDSAPDQTVVAYTVPVKSALIDRVATFLGNVPEKSTKTDRKSVQQSITENEFASWRESVHSCSHVAQLYLVVKKINKAWPEAQLRGMKRCLADLRALKSVRNTGKSRSCRLRDNMELLQRGILTVEKFLDVNQKNCIKVGRSFALSSCFILYFLYWVVHKKRPDVLHGIMQQSNQNK